MKYKNILDYRSIADAEINFQSLPYDNDYNYKDTNKSNVFSDNGAWHGYYLPKDQSLNSFVGPLVLSQEIPVNIGKYLNKLIIKYKNEEVDFNKSESQIYSLPGKLIMTYEFNDFIIKKKLIFTNSRTSLIETIIVNKTNEKIKLNISIQGNIYQQVKTKSSGDDKDDSTFWFNYFQKIENSDNFINISFNPIINQDVVEQFHLEYDQKIKNFDLNNSKESNEIIFTSDFGDFEIQSKKSFSLNSFESFFFENEKNECLFDLKEKYIIQNEERWQKYIANILKINKDVLYEDLIIKSLQTLVSNWRSPAGVIKNNFIIPSITYQDFIGAWSWDTWKIVVGVAQFDTNLAQESLEAMFDFQISDDDEVRPHDVGMIPDCIFFNYSPARGGSGFNWNERNSKPPIAAWAVYEIYKLSKDVNFLKKMYPKIVAYNNWWNDNRSVNKDFILQYGGTVDDQNDFANENSIIEAAAWESGMDNAPRFDWDRAKVQKVFKKDVLIGYVIDQISVDLNSFNYLDFISLKEIAKILKKDKDIDGYENAAQQISQFINEYMYNEETKFYYDIKSIDKRKVVDYGKGMEGILPLFAKLATQEKAKKIIENIHEKNYNQFVPFPSVSVNNSRFSENDYWRGPVWVDQLYFGVQGIANYGYLDFAKELAIKAIKNMDGLLDNAPIRENYNSLTGHGLATTNFSWSASLILIIIKDIIN